MEFNIHNVRFYDFKPKSIHCIEFNDDYKLLALSRSDNTIEIWNCTYKPFKQQDFIGSSVGSIEALAWCNRMLFSGGQYDFIFEYDVELFTVRRKVAVTGGVTWCLALSPNKNILAAGTEQGIVCLFNVTDDGLEYYKTLTRQEERIFSIGWHPNSEYLVTGSIDYVHLKHISKGQILQFPVWGTSKEQKTIVWCVALLSDMTIVTGDSRGKTCFWNGDYGTLINDIQTHQADVLTMRVVSHENAVYVAGVDPVIVEVQLVERGKSNGRKMWLKSVHRRIHTHDVRAMALTRDNKLYTGGVDTYLALSYYPPKTAIKFPATPRRGYISLSKKNIIPNILLGYDGRVELWQLGVPDAAGSNSSKYLPIKEDRVKLAEIHLKDKERLRFCALSPGGATFAYCIEGSLRVYEFVPPVNYGEARMKKIKVPKLEMSFFTYLVWLDDKILAVAGSEQLKILNVEDKECVVKTTINLPGEHRVVLMTSSPNGNFIAMADSSNSLWNYNAKVNETFLRLPRTKVPVTDLAINCNDELLVTHSNNSLSEFDLHTNSFTKFSRYVMNGIQPDMLVKSSCIRNISLKGDSFIFLHTDSLLIIVNKLTITNLALSTRGVKILKCKKNISDNDNSAIIRPLQDGFSFIERSYHILSFLFHNVSDIICIELNPIQLMDSLPPALKVKKYGAR